MSRYNLNISLLREQIHQSWLAYEVSNYEFWREPYQRYNFQELLLNEHSSLINKTIQLIVDELLSYRKVLTSSISKGKLSEIYSRKPSGKILIYNPDSTFYDCLAQLENDFFNDADIPSWQSWLQYIYVKEEPELGYLITWIPDDMLKDMEFFVSELTNGFFWANDFEYILKYENDKVHELCIEINKHFS